jgi:3',5'-cyclic-nucleotide phosphodiesterase
LWKVLNDVEDLSALILEVSFPNSMDALAKVSGHLTPQLVAEELKKLNTNGRKVRIFLYGMKPGFHDQLKIEIAALEDPRLTMLRPMDEFDV